MSDQGKIILIALGVFTLGGHAVMAFALWRQSKRLEAEKPLNVCGPGGWALLALLFGGFSLWLFRQAHASGEKILPDDARLCFSEPANPKAWIDQNPLCILHVYDDWSAADSQLCQGLLEFWRPRVDSLHIGRVETSDHPEWRDPSLPLPYLVLYRDGLELSRFAPPAENAELQSRLRVLDEKPGVS